MHSVTQMKKEVRISKYKRQNDTLALSYFLTTL